MLYILINTKKMKVDYMKPTGWKKVAIKVKTHTKLSTGKNIPTWNMQERLIAKI